MGNINDNRYKINSLNNNSTFYDWILHYNENVVGKLNKIVVYDGISGDGIDFTLGTTASDDPSGGQSTGVDLDAGIFRATLSKNIPGHLGVTFQGDVTVKGDLSFNQDPIYGSLIERTGFRVYGNTGGFTFGNVVRATTGGIKLARADGQRFGEVIGVVAGVTQDYMDICTSGVIEGDFSKALGETAPSGQTLTSGCSYFLDIGVSGGITASEPTAAGTVSKPVLLGITYDGKTSKAVVVNYRGQYLSLGLTADAPGFTANDNIAHVSLGNASGHQLTVGSIAGFNPGYNGSDPGFPVYGNGWFKVQSGGAGDSRDYTVGIVTQNYNLSGTYFIDVVGSGYIDQYAAANPGYYGLLYIQEDGTLKGWGTSYPFMFVWNQGGDDKAYIVNQRTVNLGGNPLSGGGGAFKSFIVDDSISGITFGQAFQDNLMINGAFNIWQRRVGDIADGRTGDAYFADRWVRIDGVSGGGGTSTYSLQKKSFSTTQTEIEAQPKYYITSNHNITGVTAGDHIYLVNRMEDNRFLNNEPVTLSFYAKCGVTGSTMGFVSRQYDGSSINTAHYDGVTGNQLSVGTSWRKYSVSFTIPQETTYSTDGYLDVGFNVTHIDSDFDLAQVKLERGNIPSLIEPVDERLELNKCRRYYQRSYNIDETTGSSTMSGGEPGTTSIDVLVTPLQDYYYTYPIRMRKNPDITFYSPFSGITGDVYNRTAKVDLGKASGTSNSGGSIRVTPTGATTISANIIEKDGMKILLHAGVVLWDSVSFHYKADADL
jgi:hypothetical protein